MKMKKSQNGHHNGKASPHSLLARASAAKRAAKAARNHLEMLKAEHKQARKAFKLAKKAARRARKEAKIALKLAKQEAKKAVRTLRTVAKPVRRVIIPAARQPAPPRSKAAAQLPRPAPAP